MAKEEKWQSKDFETQQGIFSLGAPEIGRQMRDFLNAQDIKPGEAMMSIYPNTNSEGKPVVSGTLLYYK